LQRRTSTRHNRPDSQRRLTESRRAAIVRTPPAGPAQEASVQTIDVPQKDWSRTLEDFSAIHDRWLVSLDVLWPDLGAQTQIRDLPLLGITAETPPAEPVIVIEAGHSDGKHLSHIIHGPAYVRIARTDEGADVAVEIESEGGSTNILRLRVPARPETVDHLQRGR
jgi:hypothetical protein